MSDPTIVKPPSRGLGVFKALVLVAVGVKMFALVAPIGPVAAIIAGAVLLLAGINLLLSIIQ